MFLRKQRFQILSILSVFLFTLITGLADAKTSDKPPKPSTKPWSVLDGFRSAKFGMTEKQVTRAITKDFKISSSKVKRKLNRLENTTSLEFSVPELLADGGKANLGYVFGQKTRKLVHVNIVWRSKLSKNVTRKDIIATANRLLAHFIKKRYQDDSIVNAKLNETTIVVFRGKDKKGRMVVLSLHDPAVNKGKVKDTEITLSLAYILDPISPDILTIKDGDF